MTNKNEKNDSLRFIFLIISIILMVGFLVTMINYWYTINK